MSGEGSIIWRFVYWLLDKLGIDWGKDGTDGRGGGSVMGDARVTLREGQVGSAAFYDAGGNAYEVVQVERECECNGTGELETRSPERIANAAPIETRWVPPCPNGGRECSGWVVDRG